jgi:hypothetical protein
MDGLHRHLKENWNKLEESFRDNAYVWDVDDTLFTSGAKVLVVRDGEIVQELSAQDYNTYELQDGEEFNFSQFRDPEILLRTAEKTPYFQVIEKINKAINRKDSDSSIYILTARGPEIEEGLRQLLESHGINNIKGIFAVGDNPAYEGTIAERKQHVLRLIRKKHKGQVTFFDDDEKNIELASAIQGIKTRLVRA